MHVDGGHTQEPIDFQWRHFQKYWIFWFPDANFSLALNINSELQRHNTYVYG